MLLPTNQCATITKLKNNGFNMLKNLQTLPIDEKIQLVEDLWDSIGQAQLNILTQAQKIELDARLDAYTIDGNKGREINTVLSDIKNRL